MALTCSPLDVGFVSDIGERGECERRWACAPWCYNSSRWFWSLLAHIRGCPPLLSPRAAITGWLREARQSAASVCVCTHTWLRVSVLQGSAYPYKNPYQMGSEHRYQGIRLRGKKSLYSVCLWRAQNCRKKLGRLETLVFATEFFCLLSH